MYDIIIVGAGIAGLTASIYASRANKKVLIIEKSNIIVENTENKLGKKLCFPYIVEKILNYYSVLWKLV